MKIQKKFINYKLNVYENAKKSKIFYIILLKQRKKEIIILKNFYF